MKCCLVTYLLVSYLYVSVVRDVNIVYNTNTSCLIRNLTL